MPQNKIIAPFLFLLLTATACIKPYFPDIRTADQSKYVIHGQITDEGGLQHIEISKTASLETATFNPVTGCLVEVVSQKGERFQFFGDDNGKYWGSIPSDLFIEGAAFRLEVTSPEGDVIVSDYDSYLSGPEMGPVRWSIDTLVGKGLFGTTPGLRFFTDLEATQSNSRLFRWEITETWEYHADYPLIWYYDGHVHQVIPPDYSRKVCWKTEQVPYVFTLNTNSLSENRFENFPLHFVSSQTEKLAYGYSVLIKQHALSEAAFNYWERLRLNNEQDAGLFEKQPVPVRGNLTNTTGSTEVLGFFGVGASRSVRINLADAQGLTLSFSTFCNPALLERGFKEIRPYEYPAYLLGDEISYTMNLLNKECVDCTSRGGTNVKPDFWPW